MPHLVWKADPECGELKRSRRRLQDITSWCMVQDVISKSMRMKQERTQYDMKYTLYNI